MSGLILSSSLMKSNILECVLTFDPNLFVVKMIRAPKDLSVEETQARDFLLSLREGEFLESGTQLGLKTSTGSTSEMR